MRELESSLQQFGEFLLKAQSGLRHPTPTEVSYPLAPGRYDSEVTVLDSTARKVALWPAPWPS